MNVALLTGKVWRSVRNRGLATTLRRACAQVVHRPVADSFDLMHGTDTAGVEPLWKFDIRSPNARFGERYEASTEHELEAALAFLGEDLRGMTFIDLGCGKGRTLLVAARMGFGSVVGVEFASELAAIASQNLRRMQIAHGHVLHADAADFPFPADDLVLYLYNPFSEQVLRKVLTNLRASGPARRWVIYKGPRCADMLDDSGFLTRAGQPPSAPHMQVWKSRG